jgi:hypothetical protein
MTLFPAIVSDTNTSARGLMADNIMTHGWYDAARIAKKQGYCFTLCYFMMFGRMPRTLRVKQVSKRK